MQLKDTSPVSVFASHCAAWLYWFFDARRLSAITGGHATHFSLDCFSVSLSSCSPLEHWFRKNKLVKRIYQGRVHPTGSQSIESPLLTLAHPGSIE
jgi:hypothetical protein